MLNEGVTPGGPEPPEVTRDTGCVCSLAARPLVSLVTQSHASRPLLPLLLPVCPVGAAVPPTPAVRGRPAGVLPRAGAGTWLCSAEPPACGRLCLPRGLRVTSPFSAATPANCLLAPGGHARLARSPSVRGPPGTPCPQKPRRGGTLGVSSLSAGASTPCPGSRLQAEAGVAECAEATAHGAPGKPLSVLPRRPVLARAEWGWPSALGRAPLSGRAARVRDVTSGTIGERRSGLDVAAGGPGTERLLVRVVF